MEGEDETVSEIELEQEFADRTETIRTSEEFPGVYGHGVVREVELDDDIDKFHVEMPDTTVRTVTLDSQPSTQVSRTYSFFEWIDIEPRRQLDAIGARIPCVHLDDEDEWIPVFPARNLRRDRALFRVVPWLYRLRIYTFERHVADSDHRDAPHFELSALPFMFLWAVGAWVVWNVVDFWWLFDGATAAVGGLVAIFLLVADRVAVQTGTVDQYDSDSPAFDPPEHLLDDEEGEENQRADSEDRTGEPADEDQ